MDYEGKVVVNTKKDDDFIGFVFSYQSNRRFYVVSWKRHDRDENGRAGVCIKVTVFYYDVFVLVKSLFLNTESSLEGRAQPEVTRRSQERNFYKRSSSHLA